MNFEGATKLTSLKRRWSTTFKNNTMNKPINCYLVSVEYGEDNRDNITAFLDFLETSTGCKIIRVRTDLTHGMTLQNPNEAFEFSGYQDGLNAVMARIESESYGSDKNSVCNVVFINDTWLTGHLKIFSSVLIKALLNLKTKPDGGSNFVGLRMPVSPEINSIAAGSHYISTWAFSLVGPLSEIKKISFYEPCQTSESFESECMPLLPNDYICFLKGWLQPRNILRGWYKSTPGFPLNHAVFCRKSLTIYLEHTLPMKLAGFGFKVCDISNEVSILSAVFFIFLRAIDRIYVNYLKLKRRIPLMIKFYCR